MDFLPTIVSLVATVPTLHNLFKFSQMVDMEILCLFNDSSILKFLFILRLSISTLSGGILGSTFVSPFPDIIAHRLLRFQKEQLVLPLSTNCGLKIIYYLELCQ